VTEDARIDGLVARLIQRHVIPSGLDVTVETMAGGVSANVFTLSFGDRRLVAKEALPRLRVADEWLSSPARVLVEADAIAFAGTVRPDNVPAIVDVDEERLVIVMTPAPAGVANWKARLLGGDIDPTIGGFLGEVLADWHSTSSADPDVLARFGDRTYFSQLRVSPFFERVAEVHPDLATRIRSVVERMMSRSVCLVHGDFSPKNMLVDDGFLWVLDWEIAHVGDPGFDLASLVSHLVCKAIHRPLDAVRYRDCAEAFLSGYLAHSDVAVDQDDLLLQIGCLVLARADGKSPADYFDDPDKEVARRLARRVLEGDVTDLAALWDPS
jgi:5-methylthioribose kinase